MVFTSQQHSKAQAKAGLLISMVFGLLGNSNASGESRISFTDSDFLLVHIIMLSSFHGLINDLFYYYYMGTIWTPEMIPTNSNNFNNSFK